MEGYIVKGSRESIRSALVDIIVDEFKSRFEACNCETEEAKEFVGKCISSVLLSIDTTMSKNRYDVSMVDIIEEDYSIFLGIDGDYILYDNDSYDLEDVSVFEKIKLDKPDYMYLYKEVKKNIERILAQ